MQDKRWWAFRIAPNTEELTEQILKNLGFEPCYPTYKKRRRFGPKRRKKDTTYATLPGMMFVAFENEPPWYRMTSMHIIKQPLTLGGNHVSLSEAAMGHLMGLKKSTGTNKGLAVGDIVKVVEGPMRNPDRLCTLVEMKKNEARVLMDMLGAPREVKTSIESLEAA